jgi:hypothetical protein
MVDRDRQSRAEANRQTGREVDRSDKSIHLDRGGQIDRGRQVDRGRKPVRGCLMNARRHLDGGRH